jgi:2TM domain
MSAIPDENLVKIKNKIHKKVKFYTHFYIYLIVCTFLTFIDYFESSWVFAIDWAYWVWIGW